MFELTEEQINLVSGAASEENRPTNPGGNTTPGGNEENRPPRPPHQRPPYVGEESRY